MPAKPPTKPVRPKQGAFRFSPETWDYIDALADSLRSTPEMTVTKTAVVEMAIRETAERRLGGKAR
jgi:hypothetical protein